MLARAVADEMKKIYKSELGPQPIPLIAAREVIDDEEVSFCLMIYRRSQITVTQILHMVPIEL